VIESLLIVLLECAGYWYSDRPYHITMSWNLAGVHPDTDLIWTLGCGDISLASGKVLVPPNHGVAIVELTIPALTVRTDCTWSYRLLRHTDGVELETGKRLIHAYPSNPLASLADHLNSASITVCERAPGISALLHQANIPHHVTKPAHLQTVDGNIVIIGDGIIEAGPLQSVDFTAFLENKTDLVVFRQPQAHTLVGFPLVPVDTSVALLWATEHPLALDLSQTDIRSLLASEPTINVIAVEHAPTSILVGSWPVTLDHRMPAALMVLHHDGQCAVLCQIPLGSWQADPRNALLLRNALAFLCSSNRDPALPPADLDHHVPVLAIPSDREGNSP